MNRMIAACVVAALASASVACAQDQKDAMTISREGEVYIPNLRVGTLTVEAVSAGDVTASKLVAQSLEGGRADLSALVTGRLAASNGTIDDLNVKTSTLGSTTIAQAELGRVEARILETVMLQLPINGGVPEGAKTGGVWSLYTQQRAFQAAVGFGATVSTTGPSFVLQSPTGKMLAVLSNTPGLAYGDKMWIWNNLLLKPSDSPGTPSDRRLKTAIEPMPPMAAAVDRLAPVSYMLRDPDSVEGGAGRQVGFVADDVEALFPELVHTGADGYLRLRYGQMTAVLTRALQETRAELATTRAELAAERARMDDFAARLAALEAAPRPAAFPIPRP